MQQAIIWLLGQSEDAAAVETVLGCLDEDRAELRETAKFVARTMATSSCDG